MQPKILYIDDNKLEVIATRAKLEKRGFSITVANSGPDALKIFNDGNEHFDLILLDIIMPEMSGIEVLQEVRLKINQNKLPVIMLSACEEPEDIVNALNLGANDYLTKPINIDVSIARINTQLRLAKLNMDSIRKNQLEAIKAMVVTYNHKINNPLSIAMLSLNEIRSDRSSEKVQDRLSRSLERIKDIVSKLRDITENEDISFSDYAKDEKMVQLD